MNRKIQKPTKSTTMSSIRLLSRILKNIGSSLANKGISAIIRSWRLSSILANRFPRKIR